MPPPRATPSAMAPRRARCTAMVWCANAGTRAIASRSVTCDHQIPSYRATWRRPIAALFCCQSILTSGHYGLYVRCRKEVEMTPTEIALFFRSGKPFEGTPHRDAKGNPFTTKPKRCDRCGGQGGSDAWKFTGWVCYKCNGRCFLADEVVKLDDADKLTKLNATADQRAAKKAAKLAADEAARKAEADARRAEFLALHGALIERAKAFTERNTFVKSVIERALDTATLT